MNRQSNSRRNFMKLAGAGAAGSLVAWNAESYARIAGSNDRVGIGVVGFSERFQDALLPAVMKNAAARNFEIVAVSDIWSRQRDLGADVIGKLTGKPIAKARNNDELYDLKQVDAVIISTADHQHALHGIEAIRAGRDAYIEKPLANTLADANAILKAARESKRVIQIGTQRRSGSNFIRARDYIQSGEFGAVNMIELIRNANQPRRWRRPALVEALRQEDTDWNRFLMGRTNDAFDPHKYVEYRLYWPYSSGIPCQWMVHHIDAVHFITGVTRPRNVVANGGVYQWRDGRVNPDTLTAVFEYGPPGDPTKSFQVLYSSRMGNSAGGESDKYYSAAGSFEADTGKVSPEGGLTERYAKGRHKATTLVEKSILSEKNPGTKKDARGEGPGTLESHVLNWMECIRSRKTPAADIRAGYDHSVALCMTIAALHSGKRVAFDESRQALVFNGGNQIKGVTGLC